MSRSRWRRGWLFTGSLLALGLGFWSWAAPRTGRGARLPAGDYAPRPERYWVVPEEKAREIRDEALARAQVWEAPAIPIERADLTRNAGDPDWLSSSELLSCRFLPSVSRGTTPKFDCIVPGGEVVKVKYGRSAEVQAEVAASHLLAALGFGADRMYVVPRLRCFGCPAFPFRTYQVLEATGTREVFGRHLDFGKYVEFEWAAVERRFAAAAIVAPGVKGWAFYELEKIDPLRGGASRAEVDALRLMAAFLHHWDNKDENQRLVCLAEPGAAVNAACPAPFALVQDLGATFGPEKVDLEKWARRPFWSDAATCGLHMEDMPFAGATFGRVRVSEAGRLFLAERLQRLTEPQIRALFRSARFPETAGPVASDTGVAGWVRAFQDKVRAIADRPPCPS